MNMYEDEKFIADGGISIMMSGRHESFMQID
jgi:hypothetical protein